MIKKRFNEDLFALQSFISLSVLKCIYLFIFLPWNIFMCIQTATDIICYAGFIFKCS